MFYQPNNTLFPSTPLPLPTYNFGAPAQTNQLIKVNGIESAKAYPTQPNSMYALFDENDDVMYIKSTDASNYPTIRRFRFTEEKEEASSPTYVTVDEFNKFKEELLNGKQFVRNDGKWKKQRTNQDSEHSGNAEEQ